MRTGSAGVPTNLQLTAPSAKMPKMMPRHHFGAADTRLSQNFQNSQKRLTQRSDPKADADKQRGEQLGTRDGLGALLRVSQGMTRRAKHRVSQFYHPTSHEDSICGPYRLLCERAERARSKISSKSSKLSKLAQLGRILKISKTLGCRCAQVPKYILRAAEVAISQKFS